jgi:phenylpropionate dioxygenase-like ring-hydroxylating dioxygenase large terminal subunit
VTGDDLACPWHGWVWDGEGNNVDIPYSSEGCKPRLKIRSYPVREWCGTVVAWYDWAKGEPQWELPVVAEYDDSEWYPMHPASSRVYELKAHVQMPQENTVDPAHVMYVHGSSTVPSVDNVYSHGHVFHSEVKVLYGGGKDATSLTPNGPMEAVFETNVYGIGISLVYWRDSDFVPTVQLTGFTAIDDQRISYFFAQSSRRENGDEGAEPTGRALAMLKTQHKVVPQDFFTWENMQYQEHANFAVEEAQHYAAFRRWASQFYPEEDQGRLAAFAGDTQSAAPTTRISADGQP